MEVGREIFAMIYFQSLSPWETDSGRLKQGIEIKRKYENYKNRWLLCQLLMYFKMEELMHLCQKNGSSHCVRVLAWCWARDSLTRIIEGLCFFWYTCPLWTGCASNVLSMYCQKRFVTCQDIFSSLWTQRSKVQYLVADSEWTNTSFSQKWLLWEAKIVPSNTQ